MSDQKMTKRATKRGKLAEKTPRPLNHELELYRHLRAGDRDPRLVILDDDGAAQGAPSKSQLKEFVEYGTIDGRHDLTIGVRYKDRRGSNMSISLTRKEAQSIRL